MQIQFDPRDASASASVLAVIFSLHPDLHPIPGVMLESDSPKFMRPGDETKRVSPAPPVGDSGDGDDDDTPPAGEPDSTDAAEAFGGNAANAATPAEPAKAGTPGGGTPAASDNGPTAPPTASPSNDAELDADGLPWDGRIHSGPADKRPKNADGRWRRKRSVDDELVEQVEAELRQVMGAPAPVPTPPVPTGNAPASPETVPAAPAPTPAPPVPSPTPAAAPTASGPAAAAPAASFAELMRKITARQSAGTLSVEQTSQIAQSLGLTGVRDLIHRADLVEAFDALLPEAGA